MTTAYRMLIASALILIHFSFGGFSFLCMSNPHHRSSSRSRRILSADSPTPTTSTTNITIDSGDMRFGRFLIPEASIFARSPFSAAFVNLRPIVPGHVLIMPQRITPHLADLTTEEYTDLWLLVRKVQAMLQQHYEATAFNVAVQDGKDAGQSVPHVHVHILPRKGGDFERNDDIYEALEEWSPRKDMVKERTNIEFPEDEDRVDRTPEMMADEAEVYRRLLGEAESPSRL
jgi:bis(5'-adenosyl)-triphosphatase